MALWTEIAPIRIQILEQHLQLAKELEQGLARLQDKAQSASQPEVRPEPRGLPVLPGLEQGEIIPARVLENMGSGRYLVIIKDTPFIADSHVPLASGSDITVRVERPAPDVRLALVKLSPESRANNQIQASQSETVSEYLRWQRANPDGIKNLLTSLEERLDPRKAQNNQSSSKGAADTIGLDPLRAKLSPESAARLLSLVKRLHFSGDARDGNWVRNYARDLGLTIESDLMRNLAGGADIAGWLEEQQDLKRSLMKIAALTQADNAAAPGAADAGGMKALAALIDSGIKSIEALQVANVILQEAHGSGAFQAPIVFQENRGTAHLFIERDGQEGTGKKGRVHRILLLLDLDRLGAMRVEASLAEGRIDCLFRCENTTARDAVTEALDGLKKSLEAAGCRISALGCIADSNIRQGNQLSLNERLGMGESLSLFA